ASCHFNIADPRFDREELVRFMERQVAQAEQPDIRTVERPVVMVEFWARAAEAAVRAGKLRQHALDTVNATALTAVNAVLGDDKVEAADLVAGLERSLSVAPDSLAARHYVDDLRSLLQNALGNEQYTQLFELYR